MIDENSGSCSVCKEIKPFTEFSRDKGRKRGYDYVCKVCRKNATIRYKETGTRITVGHRVKSRIPITEKECPKCNELKDKSEYSDNDHYPDGVELYCKPCKSAANRESYRRHSEKWMPKKKEWAASHREQVNAAVRKRSRLRPVENKARSAISYAVKTGKLVSEPCVECASLPTDFHHTNGYDEQNWFVGKWLCRKHHSDEHVRLREERGYAKNN